MPTVYLSRRVLPSVAAELERSFDLALHDSDWPPDRDDLVAAAAGKDGLLVTSSDTVEVSSHHHQGYGRLGDGLCEAARADDGTVEAIEDPARRFTLGVLWHPEEGEDAALFRALVEEAARYREERA